MKERKNTRTILKRKPKVIFITTMAVVVLIMAFYFISSGINIKTKKEEAILSYNTSSNVDYKVNLKDNNYFSEKYLKSGEQYITSIIDNIEIDYNYNLSSPSQFNNSYDYKIVAEVNADYRVDTSTTKKVWSKEYVIKEEKVETNNSSSIDIRDTVKINYEKYNNIINNFKKDYMLAVDSRVDVYMYININGNYEGEKLIDKATLLTSIPLAQQTINIKTDYINNEQKVLNKTYSLNRVNNIFMIIIGIFCAVVAIAVIIKQIIFIIEDDKKQSIYIKNLKKYLHDYSDIIAAVKKIPNIKQLKNIEFSKFEELVNAQDELRVPIIFKEIKKNEKSIFLLISQDCVYSYVLEEEKRS